MPRSWQSFIEDICRIDTLKSKSQHVRFSFGCRSCECSTTRRSKASSTRGGEGDFLLHRCGPGAMGRWTLQAQGLAALASRHLRPAPPSTRRPDSCPLSTLVSCLRHRQQVQDQQRQQQQLLCVQRAKFREAQMRRAAKAALQSTSSLPSGGPGPVLRL